MPLVDMMEIVERAIRKFNVAQIDRPKIRETFRKAGQDSWFDCGERFKAHLDSLEQDALYKNQINNQSGEEKSLNK